MKNYFLFFGFAFFCDFAYAQQAVPGFQFTYADETFRHYVSTASNMRIGKNGVLIRTLAVGKSFRFGDLVLATCDGGMVSAPLRSSFSAGDDGEIDALIPSRQVNFLPVSAASLSPPEGRVELEVAKRAKALCAGAGQEGKNIFIPVSGYKEGGDEGGIVGFLSGTAVRQGDIVDAWTRTSIISLTPRLDDQGKPVMVDGTQINDRKATGRFSLAREAYNCKQRTSGTSSRVSYKADGSVASTDSVAREKLRFDAVIPRTVGETMLDAICLLY